MIPAIEVINVTMEFETGKRRLRALERVTFDIAENEFVTLIGPSGCGKSTMLRLIADILQPTRGQIRVKGKTTAQARKDYDFGFVFQDAVLLPWRTTLSNVQLPLEILTTPSEERQSKPLGLLNLVGLSGFEQSYPRQLSGGMRQRVSIARALATNPSVLLMDEPFGALDEITRERMNRELLTIWGSTTTTVVFVTHSIPEAVYLSDRVVVFAPLPGRVKEIVKIDLPRPRLEAIKDSQEFYDHVTKVRRCLAA
ncbi:MAG: ABC transporter ATP-binding protein [Chloroflexi bacterium]|nr:ABC transporter ATP-binding protein [Chloroflexota bacterium]